MCVRARACLPACLPVCLRTCVRAIPIARCPSRRAEFGPARASPPAVAASRKSFSLAHDVTRELHKRHRSVCCGKFRGVHGGSGEVRRPLSETGVRRTAPRRQRGGDDDDEDEEEAHREQNQSS